MKSGSWMRNLTPLQDSFQRNINKKLLNPVLLLMYSREEKAAIFPSKEKADTLSMQKHAMLVVKKAISLVNIGKIAVIEGNCPLYACQKRCLHLEMCIQEA